MPKPTIPKYAAEYAAKFEVSLAVDQHGIYGDDWDWIATPAKPAWYPNAGYCRIPSGCDPRECIRVIAERIGTGRADFYGFHRTAMTHH